MRALYVILPILGHPDHRLPLLQRVHRREGHGARRRRPTPAHARPDGQNYHPTNRWVLFGHHFAAITGAGPLIGPVLAAQFGYVPGLLWLLGGVCLAGAVHDFIILWASTRRGGASLAEIARAEIGPVAGATAAIAILFIVVIALAGLGLAVVNALEDSAWGTFTIGMSIPIALFVGWYMYRLRPGPRRRGDDHRRRRPARRVVLGKPLAASSLGALLPAQPHAADPAMAAYGFIASVLPVWLLLCPRDYLARS